MPTPNEKGEFFAKLASPRGLKAQIARALGVDLPVVNNWRFRGVPPTYAYAVANLLKCDPSEISEVIVVAGSHEPAHVQNGEPSNRNEARALLLANKLSPSDLKRWLDFGEALDGSLPTSKAGSKRRIQGHTSMEELDRAQGVFEKSDTIQAETKEIRSELMKSHRTKKSEGKAQKSKVTTKKL